MKQSKSHHHSKIQKNVSLDGPDIRNDSFQSMVMTIGDKKVVCLGFAEDALKELRRGENTVIEGTAIDIPCLDIIVISGKTGSEVHAKLKDIAQRMARALG
jgi:hypothetical protein